MEGLGVTCRPHTSPSLCHGDGGPLHTFAYDYSVSEQIMQRLLPLRAEKRHDLEENNATEGDLGVGIPVWTKLFLQFEVRTISWDMEHRIGQP